MNQQLIPPISPPTSFRSDSPTPTCQLNEEDNDRRHSIQSTSTSSLSQAPPLFYNNNSVSTGRGIVDDSLGMTIGKEDEEEGEGLDWDRLQLLVSSNASSTTTSTLEEEVEEDVTSLTQLDLLILRSIQLLQTSSAILISTQQTRDHFKRFLNLENELSLSNSTSRDLETSLRSKVDFFDELETREGLVRDEVEEFLNGSNSSSVSRKGKEKEVVMPMVNPRSLLKSSTTAVGRSTSSVTYSPLLEDHRRPTYPPTTPPKPTFSSFAFTSPLSLSSSLPLPPSALPVPSSTSTTNKHSSFINQSNASSHLSAVILKSKQSTSNSSPPPLISSSSSSYITLPSFFSSSSYSSYTSSPLSQPNLQTSSPPLIPSKQPSQISAPPSTPKHRRLLSTSSSIATSILTTSPPTPSLSFTSTSPSTTSTSYSPSPSFSHHHNYPSPHSTEFSSPSSIKETRAEKINIAGKSSGAGGRRGGEEGEERVIELKERLVELKTSRRRSVIPGSIVGDEVEVIVGVEEGNGGGSWWSWR